MVPRAAKGPEVRPLPAEPTPPLAVLRHRLSAQGRRWRARRTHAGQTRQQRHLELDVERSWIVVAEGNEFLWPGYDLRKIGGTDRYDYGFLPARFFHQVLDDFAACYEMGKRQLTPHE